MKIKKWLLFILSIPLLFSCRTDDGKIDFTFLQINDVYEIAPLPGDDLGGLARVSSLKKQLLSKNMEVLSVVNTVMEL